MHPERNDEVYARELAVSLRADPPPQCPHSACRAERLYPVQGYCVLTESPGYPDRCDHRDLAFLGWRALKAARDRRDA